MKKSILLVAVLMALVSLCLVLASCDSGSSGDDPTPDPRTVIDTVTLTVTPPVKGVEPADTATVSEEGLTTGKMSWTPEADKFKGGEEYTVSVPVNIADATSYRFADNVTATVNGQGAEYDPAAGTVSYTFGRLDDRTVSSIEIKTAPAKTEYIYGESVDLTGLVLTVKYDDGTEGDIAYSEAGGSMTVDPATLNAAGDNISLTISYGGKTVTQVVEVKIKVSFDANGGSDTMASEIVEAGISYKISANGFTAPKIPVGAVNGDKDIPFVGWNTAADGTGTSYEQNGTIQATDTTANITLYAQWAKPSFSVSTDKKVYFAKGNLQATIDTSGVPTAWKFAENQFDYIGNATANTTIGSAAGDIDLFGWSTDGGDSPTEEYKLWGINTSTNNSDYSDKFKDWGKNAITNGGNTADTWRTLTKDEWIYLLNTSDNTAKYRQDANRFAKACVKEVKGLLIFPDGYTLPGGYTADGGTGMAEVNALGTKESPLEFPTVKIPDDTWTAMEAAGAVFLPAAGYRESSTVKSTGSNCNYWAATLKDESAAYYMYTSSKNVVVGSYDRYYGHSVRLVVDED